MIITFLINMQLQILKIMILILNNVILLLYYKLLKLIKIINQL